MENKYNENGGIGAYKDNGTRAFVQTYTHDEVSINYVDLNGETHTEFIRIRIGTNEGKQIVMLENGKFYMIDGFATTIDYREELSVDSVYLALTNINKIYTLLGNITELHTITKLNLVSAINEILTMSSTSRHLIGSIKYISDNLDPDDCKDLDIRFNNETKNFEYYSETNYWTPLPEGWHILQNIVRTRDDLPEEPHEGEVYGILWDEVVIKYTSGEWVEVYLETNENIGDEYLVEHVYNSEFSGNATGSVIKTSTGWRYLVHYN